MPSKSVQALKIEPSEALSFKGPFTEVVTSTITLTNPTEDKIAFKVKTTAPKRYCVRPNSGILKKDESITVSVMLQPFEFDPAEKSKHKFMIQSIVMVGEVLEADVWKDAEPEKLMDTKLRVVFDVESVSAAPASTVPSSNITSQLKAPAAQESAAGTAPAAGDSAPVTSQPTAATKKVGDKLNEDEYNRAVADNTKLLQEVASLKEESSRLRRIAMNDTLSAGSQKSTSQQELPTGLGLLFQDTNNLILILVLFLAAFAAGTLLSPSIL